MHTLSASVHTVPLLLLCGSDPVPPILLGQTGDLWQEHLLLSALESKL
jgi:hypothetical protein